ncbi:hypothetical protein [Candidatus Dactylopiibacterium carminicum]|uniref:hypothetical protein n=1 Tax=Candidatus Dactylopiibacterium carminicum TaxID=857335 RepID=UPI001482BED3|nr:hypothetical protein [Candidatus Dactylopiibacterium carminicum]
MGHQSHPLDEFDRSSGQCATDTAPKSAELGRLLDQLFVFGFQVRHARAEDVDALVDIVAHLADLRGQPTPDRVDVAAGCITTLTDGVVDDFALEPMSADGMTAFLAAVQQRLEVLRKAISLATLPLTWASQIQNLIAGIKNDLAMPAAYASALRGLTDLVGGGADDYELSDTARPRVVSRITSAARSSDTELTGVATTEGAVRRNLGQEDALRSRLLVTAAAQVALTDYRAEVDRDAALDSTVTAIDALLPGMPDATFQAAVTARAALIDALLAQDLRPAASRDVSAALPAVVLAYRLGVDESVFLARNAVRHPLFVKGRVHG